VQTKGTHLKVAMLHPLPASPDRKLLSHRVQVQYQWVSC
jgi:hypothetical protein